jgi:hypothetical protein
MVMQGLGAWMPDIPVRVMSTYKLVCPHSLDALPAVLRPRPCYTSPPLDSAHHSAQVMHLTILTPITLLLTITLAAPISSRTSSALSPRQSNGQGSTSTSSSGSNSLLNLGLTSGEAAAADDDGSSTSSTSTSECSESR